MKIKKYIAAVIILGGLSYAAYRSFITDILLRFGNTMNMKAVIEERITGKTSYSVLRYKFSYQNQDYIGFASESSGLQVSDTISIIFLESNPSMNRPQKEMESRRNDKQKTTKVKAKEAFIDKMRLFFLFLMDMFGLI